jgi:hypothetical protein
MRRRFLIIWVGLCLATVGCNSKNANNSTTDSTLPPDPGMAGMLTLEGIDSDKDSVRDDVQRYIALTYTDNSMRIALTNAAKAELVMVDNSDNADQVITQANLLNCRIECVYAHDPENATKILSGLRSRIVNTELRFRSYAKANANLSGQTFYANDYTKFNSCCE